MQDSLPGKEACVMFPFRFSATLLPLHSKSSLLLASVAFHYHHQPTVQSQR